MPRIFLSSSSSSSSSSSFPSFPSLSFRLFHTVLINAQSRQRWPTLVVCPRNVHDIPGISLWRLAGTLDFMKSRSIILCYVIGQIRPRIGSARDPFGEDIFAQTIYEGSEKPGSGLDSPTPTVRSHFWNSGKRLNRFLLCQRFVVC